MASPYRRNESPNPTSYLQASTSSSRSRPASPVQTSTGLDSQFAFPPNPYSFPASHSNSSATTGGVISPLIHPTPSTTARFHEALALRQPSSSSLNLSTSPTSSASSGKTDIFLANLTTPTRDQAFYTLQRELGVGSSTQDIMRDSSPSFGKSAMGMMKGRNEGDGDPLDGNVDLTEAMCASERQRNMSYRPADEEKRSDYGFGNDSFEDSGGRGMGSGIGRPASMDMAGNEFDRFGFPLPPRTLPPTIETSRQFAAAVISPASKGRSPRTYPAPLLLSRDRPFGGTQSGVPPPLTVRKSSNSSPSTNFGSNSSNYAPPPRKLWASNPPSSPLPAPPTSEGSRFPQQPYQQHRYQQSSTSSVTHPSTSQSSIIYRTESPNTSTTALSASTSNYSSALGPSSSASLASLSTSLNSEPPITSQALLLYVLSLRSSSNSSNSQTRTNPPSSSTSSYQDHQRIQSSGSVNSEGDEAATTVERLNGRLDVVDLSHKRIADIPLDVIEEMSDEVEKLALGYNLLRSLPPQLAALQSLRYLNIRVNMLTVFPQILCEMPSLDILDISRNKIRRFPTNPGTLLQLKVFSCSRNRIKRLPLYISQMSRLEVLRIDRNPLEWPPREISLISVNPSSSGSSGDGEARKESSKVEEDERMAAWLESLKTWLRANGEMRPKKLSIPLDHLSDDERSSPQDRLNDSSNGRINGTTTTENGRHFPPAEALDPPPSSRPLRTNQASSPRTRTPIRNDSVSADDQHSRQPHLRNASHSTISEPERRPGLKSKKSLPDLRQSHADILAERRTGAESEDVLRQRVTPSLARRQLEEKLPVSLPPSSFRPPLAVHLSSSLPGSSRSTSARVQHTPPVQGLASRIPVSTAKADFETPPGKLNQNEVAGNASGFERNSGAYFRRLSMLPASTISKAVPTTLLEFADAIRGILFSLSQMYNALRQFVVFASQDRLPAALARLMGTADGSTSLLINALDRFDSFSRRGTPDPAIVRDIFVTCRDNVVIFGRLVTALGPHLKALLATADVRYARTLLVLLYGSMGEIANSWNSISPKLQELSSTTDTLSITTLILQPPTPSPTNLSGGTSSRPTTAGVYRARSRTRRHAGSFSVEDVQLGAVIAPAPYSTPVIPAFEPPTSALPTLPSNSPTPQFLPTDPYSGYNVGASGTIKGRSGKPKLPLSNSIPLPPQPGYQDMLQSAFDQPMTPGAGIMFTEPEALPSAVHNNFNGGASLNATSIPSSVQPYLSRNEGARNPLPVPPAPSAGADEMFLEMVEATTSVAFDVYGMLLDSFDEEADGEDDDGAGILMRDLGPRRTKELTDMCILGNEQTTKLRGALGRVRGLSVTLGSLKFSTADAKRLGDESYAFVQTVIRFAKLVKAISLEHGFAPRIREGVGQLTIATREFAKHLSHSQTSFRPIAPPSSSSSSVSNTGMMR